MKASFKNIIKKISAAFVCALLILCTFPKAGYASGSYWLSSTSLSVTQGSSTTFSFGATDAVGAFTLSTGGGVSASCSSENWVDNSSVTITVTGDTVGTGYVYISVYDGADYDGNDLSGKSYTVTVTVKSASGGTISETTTTSQTEATTTTEETTTVDPEIELLTVTVDDASMLVSKEISDDDVIEGFSVEETVYNTVTVQCLVYEDIVVYILEDEEGNTGYYTLNSGGVFEPLRYTTLSKKICIFLDMPENLDIPYGYSLIETEIYGFTVEALVVDEENEDASDESVSESDETEPAAEEDESSSVQIKQYYVVGTSGVSEDEDIEESSEDTDSEDTAAREEAEDEDTSEALTTIDDMVASTEGHYYVYCLLEGEKVLCDYDSQDNILQRCTAIFEIEEDIVEEAVVTEDIEEEDIDIEKLLFIEVVIACGIIVVLIIVLIIVLVVKHKNKKDPDFVDDIDFDEEELFEEKEPVYIPDSVQRRADIRRQQEQSSASCAASEPDADAPVPDINEGSDEAEAFAEPQSAQDKDTQNADDERSTSSEAAYGSSAEFLLNIDSFFDDEIEQSLDSGRQNRPDKEPEAESEPEEAPEGSGEFSVDMEIEDITEILSGEFSDILKYVGDEEE